MDGFFVAKFKVNKKTKAQKSSGQPAAETEIDVDEDVPMEEDAVAGVSKFSNEEDEALIRGTLCAADYLLHSSSKSSSIDSKRQALKARGIKVAPATDDVANKPKSKKSTVEVSAVPKKQPKEKSRPRPVAAAAKTAPAAAKGKKVAKTTAA